MRMNRKAAFAVGAGIAVLVLAACSDSSTAPSAKVRSMSSPAFAVAANSPSTSPIAGITATIGTVQVCNNGPQSATFTASRTGTGGDVTLGTLYTTPFTLAAGTCTTIAAKTPDVTDDAPGFDNPVRVTIDLTSGNFLSASASYTTVGVDGCGATGAAVIGDPSTVCMNNYHGSLVTFTTTAPPPPGNEGCTPGYWKQDQHFDSYPAGITPNTSFKSIFTLSTFNGSFLDALSLNGGDINALIRHAAAGYLNALSSGVDYAYTTAQVIAIFNGTGLGAGLTIEERKNLLEAANNGVGGCPLN